MAHSMDEESFLKAWPLAAPFLREIREIEEELTLIWPGWTRRTAVDLAEVPREMERAIGADVASALIQPRVGEIKGEPFAGYPIERIARLKYLLKRESLLRRGLGAWYVVIAWNATRTACFAHPHPPPAPAGWAPPPKVGAVPPSTKARPSAAALAFGLRLPLERVEAAVAALGTEATPEAVRAWVQQPEAL